MKKPSHSTFVAWAEWPDGTRTESVGSGPSILTFMCDARRNGATRNGYLRRQ